MGLTFEWDPEKADNNLIKHGVSFEEATTVFEDSLSLTIQDPIHSVGEERLIIIGQSHSGRTLVVIHTEKGDNIRVVSARLATKIERTLYEEKQK